jgi:hypothetical protein
MTDGGPSPALSTIDLPDLSELKGLVTNMKDTLVTLASSFEKLGKQTADVAGLKPEFDSAHQVIIILDLDIHICIDVHNIVFQIKHIRGKLQQHERKQEEKIEELRNLLENELKSRISDEIRAELAKTISEEVEKKVRDEVTRQVSWSFHLL